MADIVGARCPLYLIRCSTTPFVIHQRCLLPVRFASDSFHNMGNPAFDYRSLTVTERLQLVGDIWDSIAEEASALPDVLPLSESQKAELDRRIAEYDANPSSGVPMDEALARIRAQFRRPA